MSTSTFYILIMRVYCNLSISLVRLINLHRGRVKHDSDTSTNTLRRQIPGELALHNTIASMRPADLSPVDAEFGTILSWSGCLGNVSNFLSKVEGNLLFGINTLDFDETGVVVLVAKPSFVTEDGAVDVKSDWLSVLLPHLYY